MARPAVLSVVLGWLAAGLIAAVWCAYPCSSWSNARRPMIRSAASLFGLPSALRDDRTRSLILAGNATLRSAQAIAWSCWKHGVPAVFENPQSSLAWRTPRWVRLQEQDNVFAIVCDQCQFGSEWRKATRLLLVHVSQGAKLERRCHGKNGVCSRTGRPHVQVIGSSLSRRSAAYPPRLAAAGAKVLADSIEARKLFGLLRFSS